MPSVGQEMSMLLCFKNTRLARYSCSNSHQMPRATHSSNHSQTPAPTAKPMTGFAPAGRRRFCSLQCGPHIRAGST